MPALLLVHQRLSQASSPSLGTDFCSLLPSSLSSLPFHLFLPLTSAWVVCVSCCIAHDAVPKNKALLSGWSNNVGTSSQGAATHSVIVAGTRSWEGRELCYPSSNSFEGRDHSSPLLRCLLSLVISCAVATIQTLLPIDVFLLFYLSCAGQLTLCIKTSDKTPPASINSQNVYPER